MSGIITADDFVGRLPGFSHLAKKEQVLLFGYFITKSTGREAFTVKELSACFDQSRVNAPGNIHREVDKLVSIRPSKFIRKGTSYSLQRDALSEMENEHKALWVGKRHPDISRVNDDLRKLLPTVKGRNQKDFLEEAIKSFEVECFRAAYIMTWLLVVDILYDYVLKHKLVGFNQSLASNNKYKNLVIESKDDFGEVKEGDFIMFLKQSGAIDANVKKMLVAKLDFRNTCAHPNSFEIRPHKVTAYIDELVTNAIGKFQ